MAISLDEIDVRLLKELETDADRPNVELARIVGLSPAATPNRGRRLQEKGGIGRSPSRAMLAACLRLRQTRKPRSAHDPMGGGVAVRSNPHLSKALLPGVGGVLE